MRNDPANASHGHRLRLAYLTNIPTPYRRAMVAAWAQANPDLEISTFYTDQDDQGRGWSTPPIGSGVRENRLLPGIDVPKYGKLNRGIRKVVSGHDILMIGGVEQAGYLAAALWARALGKPVLLLFDGFSPARFETETAPVLALKRLTARLSNGFFANGTIAARYLREQLRVGESKPLFDQKLSHVARPIAAARTRWQGMTPATVRQTLGMPVSDRPMLLSCGYLIPRKRIDLTIDAIAEVSSEDRPELLIVGTGPLENELAAHAKTRGVTAHFAGFHQGEALANYYFAADGLILSSSDDPWGLVINEAMDAGLPVIISDACGAAADLVHPGINGFVFKSGDATALSSAIKALLSADLQAMGKASRAVIADWTPEKSAQNLTLLLANVCATDSQRP